MASLVWPTAVQGAELARGLRASQGSIGQHDLVILCSGQTLPAHRSVLAAASPLLASLLEEESRGEEVQELCCPGLQPRQASQLLQFIYQGQVEGLGVAAAEELVEAVGHLQVTGLLPGRATLVPSISSFDDDVFTGPDVYAGPEEEEVAVDLSPVTRQPPVPASTLFSRHPPCSNQASRRPGSLKPSNQGFHQEEILHRIKKPKPLTMPHLGEPPVYLKPRTPRTPLLASPDCHVLEERFRHLIEGRDTDTDKLRNLSVSSADFNYDPNNAGGSMPGTPGSGLRGRSFNFPDRPHNNVDSSLDLSIRRTSPRTSPPPLPPPLSIPSIHVDHVKPEPVDSAEEESQHYSYQLGQSGNQTPKIEPVEEACYLLPVGAALDNLEQQPPTEPLYQLLVPQKLEISSPLPPNTPSMPMHHQSSSPILKPPPKKKSSNGRKRNESAGKPGERQSFKCQKCGKCYNWNYNLNRHMRFECGIENRFECSLCHKRFPYKQNAAIHLKRKHKLGLDMEAPGEKAPTPGVTADLMIAAGHITLLPVTSGPS